ncbi:TRAP transporter small permease [Croceibacterium aestuarii]|uniref:TRAP transporter small permease n=1 Tax=Croceibacterium aestuarii TaxID=3064139 RepID=UPI00272ED9A9|nr:TRAP transporter small permease subunit [Croceibacterium sp. D39]
MRAILVWTGGAALLAAMAIDTLAVIGRNVGMPIIGSIELVQAAILVSGTIALVLATLHGGHARVRLVIDRLQGAPRHVLAKTSRLASTCLFAALACGSIWLAADLWSGHERSEVVGVPWRILRLIANAGFVACTLIALAGLVRGADR